MLNCCIPFTDWFLPGTHQLKEIAIKTGVDTYDGSGCHAVMNICDAQGKCCHTSNLDNPGHNARRIGETDIFKNTTILGNCITPVVYNMGCSFSKRFSNSIDFQGTLLGDPVTATLTTNDDNEDGNITTQNNFLSSFL